MAAFVDPASSSYVQRLAVATVGIVWLGLTVRVKVRVPPPYIDLDSVMVSRSSGKASASYLQDTVVVPPA